VLGQVFDVEVEVARYMLVEKCTHLGSPLFFLSGESQVHSGLHCHRAGTATPVRSRPATPGYATLGEKGCQIALMDGESACFVDTIASQIDGISNEW
jgi:hypothetical protein